MALLSSYLLLDLYFPPVILDFLQHRHKVAWSFSKNDFKLLLLLQNPAKMATIQVSCFFNVHMLLVFQRLTRFDAAHQQFFADKMS
jgi:hypothetical protein